MAAFDERFSTRAQAERYRDRYRTGRHARTDQREHEALRRLLAGVERVPAALDLPCGVGRFSSLLAEHADRIVMADSSPIMLELAREELPDLPAEYLCTCAEDIDLTDESVDLVFSHRFLTHIDDADLRRRILVELSRVSRRYLVLSFYPPSLRNRCRWSVGCALRRKRRCDQLATMGQFLDEVSACGLQVVGRETLRAFPASAFFLFERVQVAASQARVRDAGPHPRPQTKTAPAVPARS